MFLVRGRLPPMCSFQWPHDESHWQSIVEGATHQAGGLPRAQQIRRRHLRKSITGWSFLIPSICNTSAIDATLSHCWAKDNMARLTVDNLSLWTQSIPTKILPRTFLDAVRVARRLGINYLWIDCLCIIQDGDELADWKQEAPTMHNVYFNACFNICAPWGPELGGLFATRDQSTVEHASLEMPSKNGWKRKFLLVSSGNGDGDWEELVEDSTLASRGWEIVLYECYEQPTSESVGVDVLTWRPLLNRKADDDDITSSPNIRTFLPTGWMINREELYQAWYNLVKKYSGTELTFAEDTLAAIAGITQQFTMLSKENYIKKDVYVAGLWLSRLSIDMLWKNLESMPDHEVEIRENDLEGKEPDEKFILPQVTCVKWRTPAHTEPEQYLFNEVIIMLPSTRCIEVMFQGVLKRMLLRKGLQMFHVFPVGAIAVPEPEQGLEALEKRESDSGARGSLLVWAGLDFAAKTTDISVLNRSRKLFYVPWYDNDDRSVCGLSNTYCLLLELLSREMGRFRRIGLLRFGAEYRDLYFASQVDEQYYPCWKYDQSTRDHILFII
ncbi:5e15792d-3999-4fc8-a9d3-0ab21ca5e79f [Sclerotinia trifoliorum]|uniref:5e15792d-3999-4fc8-a9d3-0ab21ca5e79f n=1 Tax=Sclerotinia trifoliorum TaxID=28548 RepID=A0A8H2ZXH4_9HELO|nr:5e15792d-3999-4fc8-a9d3-0ab21ca5e79f [Sclerotinia trifoliorum]